MKVLVYEHLSGGGLAGQCLPAGLLSEGYAMLSGVASDFQAAGDQVTVLLDERLAGYGLPLQGSRVLGVSADENFLDVLVQAAECADAVLVVAPEDSKLLYSIVQTLENHGRCVLNCQPNAIEQATDKKCFSDHLKKLGLPYPNTQTFGKQKSSSCIKKAVEVLGFPLVFKPASGAGCSGISFVQNSSQIETAVEKIRRETQEDIIVQEFIEGVAASVSLLCTENHAVPLSLNSQDLTLASPDAQSSYNGGCVPLKHNLHKEVFEAAKRLAESFSGLRGYVGVDLLLTKHEVYLMELNPRLTTSYVGLRKTSQFNIANAITNAATHQKLPPNPLCKGYSCFSKVAVPKTGNTTPQKISRIDGVASPPFPVAGGLGVAFVVSHGETRDLAVLGLQETKKQLLRNCNGGAQT
ncbi:MAG: ATP-grasp domain-containing protein [Candidatus Bathyarchaeota archaeon]|nr:ATP-grasp domain-containing protein [Candidatus Bathyarchaeota archaeon]